MGKYLNSAGTRCIYCNYSLFPREIVINKKHLYPVGLLYSCGYPCNKTKIWTNSIRGNVGDLISYLQGEIPENFSGVCNDLYCGKCFRYVYPLKTGYRDEGWEIIGGYAPDLFGCKHPDCDNRFIAWSNIYDKENPDPLHLKIRNCEDLRSYYEYYRAYERMLPDIQKLVSQGYRKNPRLRPGE